MTQVENENEQEEINWDNPVSPNQQENMQIVETEQTMESGDDTWEEELDRICKEKLSAVHEAQKEIDFELPIDDMSPITLWALLSDFVKKLPLTHMNFNLRLILLFFCFVSCRGTYQTCSDLLLRVRILSRGLSKI